MRKILLTLLFGIFGLTTTFASFPISKNITSIEKEKYVTAKLVN